MTLAERLWAAGIKCFPCTPDKRPAVKGWQHPLPPDQYTNWGPVIGIPIPEGAVAVDLDTYKGCTRHGVETALGSPVDWSGHLQNTRHGGQHVGFRAPDWPLRQGSDLLGVPGFDLRVAGKGYICAGEGYEDVGLFQLACPAMLPALPDSAREALQLPPPAPQRTYDGPALPVETMLAHIDPGPRENWLKVMFGLKAEGVPFEVFDRWSQGTTLGNYDPGRQRIEWDAAKPQREGGPSVTMGSLVHMAQQNGWTPPPGVDAAAAFSGANVIPITAAARKPAPAQVDYGKDHFRNAVYFLESEYPNSTLRYIDEEWHAYTGKSWRILHQADLAGQFTQAMLRAGVTGSSTILTGTITALKGVASTVRPDPCPDIILFNNGALHVPTRTLRPHSPDYFILGHRPYDYDPGAQCPQWLAFLDQVYEGDQERVQLLQEITGYMLTDNYDYHVVVLLIGPPRCGKSTIGDVLEGLVGPANFIGGSLTNLASDSFIHSLIDKSVMFMGDAEDKIDRTHGSTAVSRLKSISGHDAVTFDRKYKSSASVRLPTRILIATNHIPKMFDDGGGLMARTLVLHSNASFLGREDRNLPAKLKSELSGITNWALGGWEGLQARGQFIEPLSTVEERRDIREAFSPLEQFVSERCEQAPGAICKLADLYSAYLEWSMQNGERQLGRNHFRRQFSGVTRQKFRWGQWNGVRGYSGLRLCAPPTA